MNDDRKIYEWEPQDWAPGEMREDRPPFSCHQRKTVSKPTARFTVGRFALMVVLTLVAGVVAKAVIG